MSDGIHLSSLQSLVELETALAHFSARMNSALDDVERMVLSKRDQLEQIVDQRKRSLAYWQDAYDSADPEEDDVGAIRRRLEEVRDELDDARRWERKIEEAYQQYSRRAREAIYLCTDHSTKARAELSQKISELRDYAAFKLEAAGILATAQTASSTDGASYQQEIPSFPTAINPATTPDHNQNYQKFMDDFAARKLSFHEIGRTYVELGRVRGVEGEDWNEESDGFWNHHGNGRDFYESMAAVYPKLRQLIEDGYDVERLRENPELKRGVDFWWSKTDPVKVTRYRDSFFVDEGHHRVTLAKRYGFRDLPCEVTEANSATPANA